jgi:hypothetical protein
MITPVTVTAAPFLETVNAELGAVVELSALSYVSTTEVPVVFTLELVRVGPWLTVERLLAKFWVNVAVSLPRPSCNAELLVNLLNAGGVYLTDTVAFAPIGDVKFRTTVRPLVVRLEISVG